MKALTHWQAEYAAVGQVFHFATREHYALWFTGHSGRHRRTERVLPALVKKGKLVAVRYGKKLVYATPDRYLVRHSGSGDAIHFEHGLTCTEILIRLILADNRVEAVSEKKCAAMKWGCIPEWAVRYPNGKAILLEYCTADNVRRGKVPAKVVRYREALPRISQDLRCDPVVLFVLDVTKEETRIIAERCAGDEPFLFVSLAAFREVPTDRQLTTPIYIWSGDGQTHPLREDGELGSA